MSNVALGVTVCNQKEADLKIPLLIGAPAAMRFVSVEPMLDFVDLDHIRFDHFTRGSALHGSATSTAGICGQMSPNCSFPKIDWVICGGESGPGARRTHPDWVRSLRDQCASAGTPFFFKQWGEWAPRALDLVEPPGLDYGPGEKEPERIAAMVRVGRKAAGALLDGREWKQRPDFLNTGD